MTDGMNGNFLISVQRGGGLVNSLADVNPKLLYRLKIVGEINGSDVLLVRNMRNLQELDISEARIVSGGYPYYKDCMTHDDVIGEYFMYGVANLRNIVLPVTVKEIGKYAFADCTALSSISIPNCVTDIDEYAFSGCTDLTEVVLEDGSELLSFTPNGKAFSGCPIRSVYLGRNINFEGFDYTFSELLGCADWVEEGSPFGWNPHLETVVVGKKTEYIPNFMFDMCKNLSSVYISNDLEVGYNSFSYCERLSQFVVLCNSVSLDFDDVFTGNDFARVVFDSNVSVVNINTLSTAGTYFGFQLNSPVPPAVEGVSRKGFFPEKNVLYVPEGCVPVYSSAPFWKDFGKIVEI